MVWQPWTLGPAYGSGLVLPQPHYTPDVRKDHWQTLDPIYSPTDNPESIVDNYWFVDEYVQALDQGRNHECSGAEERHALEVIMGVFEPAAYGMGVNLLPNRPVSIHCTDGIRKLV